MSLQAAFRKRIRKAASRPGLPPVPGPSRKISGHKDRQGSTAHHGGGSGKRLPGERTEAQRRRKPYKPYAGPISEEGTRHQEDWERGERWKGKKRPGGGKFKQVPADNPYAGGHRNVVAATMKAAVIKAVRMVAKHKDKRGSTAHHGKGGGREKRPALSVPEKHQLRVARRTVGMRPEIVDVPGRPIVGGPNLTEAKEIIERLTGRPYKEPKEAQPTRRYAPSSQGGDLDVQDPREEGLPRNKPAVGPGVTGGWQAEERQSPSSGGRPMPDPIVIDPDETPAQQRARRQERDE